MRSPARALLTAPLLAGLLALSARGAGGEEPLCQRWKVDVTCKVEPMRIALGEEFAATVTAKNAGDVALTDLTIQLRADAGGAPCIAGAGAGVKTLVPRLEPGESKQVSARFMPETVGSARVLGSARDSLGWAAGNCGCDVEITGYPGLSATIATRDAQGEPRVEYKPGETLTYVVEVKNHPADAFPSDLKVDLALPKEIEFVSGKADGDAKVTGSGRLASTAPFRLTADRPSARFEFTVKAVTASPGLRLKSHATVRTVTGVPLVSPVETTAIEEPPAPPDVK